LVKDVALKYNIVKVRFALSNLRAIGAHMYLGARSTNAFIKRNSDEASVK